MTTPHDFVLFLVEDNEDDHYLFIDSLKRDLITCHLTWFLSAENALTALESLTGDRLPHLIISDLDMPGMGGHSFLERIRGDSRLQKIPIIIMTSSLSPDDRDYCSLADHYFVKPRTRLEWGVINALVRRYRAHASGLMVGHPPITASQSDLPLILHVEDQADDRALFEIAFQRSGVSARLLQVTSAEEAHEFLRSDPRLALVVLDLTLPGSSGKDLLADLRTNAHLRQVPVIILSGSDRFNDMQDCHDLYVIDYVVKPATHRHMTEFISTFRQWFDSSLARSLVRSRDQHEQ